MASGIDQKYFTDTTINLMPGQTVHEYVLNYVVAVKLPGGVISLVPTQGNLISLGAIAGTNQLVWALLRWHRRPRYFVRENEFISIRPEDLIPEEKRTKAEAQSLNQVVYDRRHDRIEEAWHTPGEPANLLGCHDAVAHHEALSSTGAALG